MNTRQHGTVLVKQMYFFEQQITAKTALLYILVLHFLFVRAENVSVYFSLYEDRAISRGFIASAFAEDLMLCTRACAAEMNCNTANYVTTEKKCYLSKKRMGHISSEADLRDLQGCYLIEKVKIAGSQQSIQDPQSPISKWLHFMPQWCTVQGRVTLGKTKTTAEECKEKCKEGCPGVEWWEGSRSCYQCTDPSKRTTYSATKDAGYPPHVFLKING